MAFGRQEAQAARNQQQSDGAVGGDDDSSMTKALKKVDSLMSSLEFEELAQAGGLAGGSHTQEAVTEFYKQVSTLLCCAMLCCACPSKARARDCRAPTLKGVKSRRVCCAVCCSSKELDKAD